MQKQGLALLGLLSDGAFHSGDELGEALGLSRASIWKLIKGLQIQGVDIHAVKGRGYRLPVPLELLSAAQIISHLPPTLSGLLELEVLAEIDSTNSHCMRRLQAGDLSLGEGRVHVCLAEQQSAGRGRRGRTWVSPFGRNIYLSMAREFAGGAASLEGLSLVVGLAAVEALKSRGVVGLRLKWPNDVLLNGCKLAGILLEMVGDVTGNCQVIIGLGLNLDCGAEQVAMAAVDQPWTDLASSGFDGGGRNRLVAALIEYLLPMLSAFEQGGFAPFREAWLACHANQNAPVLLQTTAGSFSGLARGVDDSGALLLETATGLQRYSGGEVSMRTIVGEGES